MVFRKESHQRGAGTIGCLFVLAIVAFVGYAGYQFGLPRLRHSSFDGRITESYLNFQQRPVAEIQGQIIQIASEFDIELTPAQVRVANEGGRLKIDVRYEKVIDLKFWQKTVTFHLSRNPAP